MLSGFTIPGPILVLLSTQELICEPEFLFPPNLTLSDTHVFNIIKVVIGLYTLTARIMPPAFDLPFSGVASYGDTAESYQIYGNL